MGPLIIMVVLVCGFWYTENHYQSRIRQARTNGWNSYFYVAMHGCKFAIQGFMMVSLLYLLLMITTLVFKIISLFEPSLYANLFSWMTEIKIMSYPLFFVLSMVAAVLLAYEQGLKAKRALENEETRQKAYREMAAQDGIEALLVQAIDEGKLIFVTLKSRKVYIGYVAAPRMEHQDTQHLAIIPYISGYRDKDTLRYHEQHRYYELYLSKNVTADSSPLNFNHFRHVIPMEQIEAVSLFDTETYKSFDDFSTSELLKPEISVSA
ncbi:hypothetical protein NL54_06915 [Pantoea stewartii]|uniref:hypothetical protein n=1 Tax=Pantoea stewartii TaxID=66269 RepID=UPI0005429FED|nr:hypothetical protein [Pantoea stewartii]KHE02138.1 hypothetical protein NL54_06915 [Pantoea stewartii]KHN61158.1 hypothetical protein OI73_17235 [Pantoea stewartii]